MKYATSSEKTYSLDDLLSIMARLRDPENGCPWDLKQSFETIIPHTLEEAYEVADAIEQGDFAEVRDELGDLLLQIVFYSQLAKEDQLFEFDHVVQSICEKLIRRHPHIFGDEIASDADEVLVNWEAIKQQERAAKGQHHDSILDSVPPSMPGLIRALKLQKKCSKVGFDWPDIIGAADKIAEEADEIAQAIQQPDGPIDEDHLAEELGDLMFATVNVIRHMKRDPETVMRQANRKFERRFRKVETLLKEQGLTPEEAGLELMDGLWDQAKLDEN